MTRVLIIGLDGMPLDLVKAWAAEGRLPNLKRLMDEGVVAPLNSTVPHTSGPAWSSFMTGMNPGKTGIFDFLYRREGSYAFFPANGVNRAGRTLWGLLSAAGKRVGVMNVPMTYPVEQVSGTMVGGFMTPFFAGDFTHPPELRAELDTAVGKYHIYPFATFTEGDIESYFEASYRLLDMRTQAARHLMARDAWDFFMLVFFDTDRVLHQMWHHIDPSHPVWDDQPNNHVDRSEPVKKYFSAVDARIGELLGAAGEDTLVFVMSDHGMGPTRHMIVLNTWLLQEGFLRLKRNPLTLVKRLLFKLGFTLRNVHLLVDKLGLARHAEYKALYSADWIFKKLFLSFDDVDWSRSVAYSFGRSNGPVYVNVRGREPHGCVEPGEDYERVRRELTERARQMRHPESGELLVGEVTRREDIYHGPYLEQAPDLILDPLHEADKFYGLSDFGSNKYVQPMYRYTGMHRQHGTLIAAGPGIDGKATLELAQLTDLMPTVLAALGVGVPRGVDGKPLLSLFKPEARPQVVWTDDGESDHVPGKPGYSDDEARQVEDRLRSLGYLG